MMNQSFKKFTPYKTIGINQELLGITARDPSQPKAKKRKSSNKDETVSQKNIKTKEDSAGSPHSSSRDTHQIEPVSNDMNKKPKEKHGKNDANINTDKTLNKENNRQDSIILIEDSNDAFESEECVVLDSNSNLTHSSELSNKPITNNDYTSSFLENNNNTNDYEKTYKTPTNISHCLNEASKVYLDRLFRNVNTLKSPNEHANALFKPLPNMKTSTNNIDGKHVNTDEVINLDSEDQQHPVTENTPTKLKKKKKKRKELVDNITGQPADENRSSNVNIDDVNDTVLILDDTCQMDETHDTSDAMKQTNEPSNAEEIVPRIINAEKDVQSIGIDNDGHIERNEDISEVCIIDGNTSVVQPPTIRSIRDESVIIDLEIEGGSSKRNSVISLDDSRPLIVFDNIRNDQSETRVMCKPILEVVNSGSDVICMNTATRKKKRTKNPDVTRPLTKKRKKLKKQTGGGLDALDNNASRLKKIESLLSSGNAPRAAPSNQSTQAGSNQFIWGDKTNSSSSSHAPVFIPLAGPSGNNRVCFRGLPSMQPPSSSNAKQGWCRPATSAPVSEASHESNIFSSGNDASKKPKSGLRPVIIDGSNVAMEHMKSQVPTAPPAFSCKGIKMVVDYFKKRGHTEIFVFIPNFRKHSLSTVNPEILESLEKEGIMNYTPSRRVEGKFQCSYDDRYIVQVATEYDGIIVSNDRYRDIMQENDKWKTTIEKRLLMFNFVRDLLMFPQDPLGRNGPTLDQFLKF